MCRIPELSSSESSLHEGKHIVCSDHKTESLCFSAENKNLSENVAFAEYGGSNRPRAATTVDLYFCDENTVDRATKDAETKAVSSERNL